MCVAMSEKQLAMYSELKRNHALALSDEGTIEALDEMGILVSESPWYKPVVAYTWFIMYRADQYDDVQTALNKVKADVTQIVQHHRQMYPQREIESQSMTAHLADLLVEVAEAAKNIRGEVHGKLTVRL